MKRAFFLLTFLTVASIPLLAQWQSNGSSRHGQRETLFSNWTDVSAFGGPIVELGNVADQFTTGVGGGGALIFNNTFFLGGYGMGLTNEPTLQLGENPTESASLDFGHGGFWLGLNAFPGLPVHPTFSARLGWGKATLVEDGTGTLNSFGYDRVEDNIFVATPMAGLEVNVTDWFVVRAQYGYRFVSGLEFERFGMESTELDGHFGSLTFGFGGF